MKFSFKNLGPVESADIEVKGLTVITGLNDTGKSFISKGIYSLIKTVVDADHQAFGGKWLKTSSALNQIFSLQRQVVPFDTGRMHRFNPNEVLRAITEALRISNESGESVFRAYLSDVITDLSSSPAATAAKQQVTQTISRINAVARELLVVLSSSTDNEVKFRNFFNEIVIQKIFQGELSSSDIGREELHISVSEGETNILEVNVVNNQTNYFKLNSLIFFEDATIIETPTILQLAKFITNALAFPTDVKRIYQQRSELPWPYYDLLSKLNLGGDSDAFFDIFQDITKTIGGEVLYKIEEGSFVFKKENGHEVKSFNIATGIKALGLLQLLLRSRSVHEQAILIVDEPEVHLHPKWEILYAKMLVSLAVNGVPIIVSSHSPYFLRALTVYIKEFDAQEISKFYYGEKGQSGASVFTDVTNDLSPIFIKLAEPMQDILTNP